ncbi:DUF5719 family protein [Arsenicicoccus sp. oral taxon 190]|uniref:DUF5719 family protein n=1 Tax=Arsenicicoccus sp. oral taxon 190 TaxID=1658671 RepID=UPI000679FA86|nr:DUF5719 family protein [Arsenicicoccus sp. oral taxon 190]AKT51426.1 hypothetical protein ADJ73_09030 [Arsenicicoccus sp. oral taxon 190]
MRGGGVLRVLGVTVVGAALVAGATTTDTRWLVAGSPQVGGSAEQGRSVPITSRTLVCPGPETLGVPGLPVTDVAPATLAATAAPAGVAGAVPATRPTGTIAITASAGGQELGRTTAPGDVVPATVAGAASALVRADGRLAPTVTAVQQTLVPTGEHAGLSSVPCSEPVADAWLLGGSGQAGRQEHLVLTNPHDTAVTVDVTLHGTRGPVIGVAGQGIVVQPRGRTVVLLDALDGSEPAPAAHLVARGGTVHAVMHDGWLDGIVPRGGDDVMVAVAPDRLLVVPGLAVAGEADPAVVRVAVPGDRDADLRVTVLGPTGPAPVEVLRRRVRGGATADLGLPALPAGSYAVQVEASVPVAAAGYVGRADGQRPAGGGSVAAPVHDLAWVPATAPLDGLTGLPLARPAQGALTHRLALSNPGASPTTATVTLVDAAGRAAPRPVPLPSRSAVSIDLGDARSVWVTPGPGGVRAAVVTEAPGGLVTIAPLVTRPQATVPYAVTPDR